VDRTSTCLLALVGPLNPVKLRQQNLWNRLSISGWLLKPKLSKAFEIVFDFSSKQSLSRISFLIFFIFIFYDAGKM
jgi:hypothetical protein